MYEAYGLCGSVRSEYELATFSIILSALPLYLYTTKIVPCFVPHSKKNLIKFRNQLLLTATPSQFSCDKPKPQSVLARCDACLEDPCKNGISFSKQILTEFSKRFFWDIVFINHVGKKPGKELGVLKRRMHTIPSCCSHTKDIYTRREARSPGLTLS